MRKCFKYTDEFKKEVAEYYKLPQIFFKDVIAKFDLSKSSLSRILKETGTKTKTNADKQKYAFLCSDYLQRERRAKKRNIDFLVSRQYLSDLYYSQNKLCPYTGIELKFPSSKYGNDGNISLDRIDSSKHYIEGNVQWVYKYINWMKSDLTSNQFITICHLVAEKDKGNQRLPLSDLPFLNR